jgi:hypothetical protein
MQLRFTSFVVINLRRDLHPQECAHAGRTSIKAPAQQPGFLRKWVLRASDHLKNPLIDRNSADRPLDTKVLNDSSSSRCRRSDPAGENI